MGNQLGDGGLDTGGIQGETDAVYRKYQLVNSQGCLSQRAGQQNPVSKTNDARQDTGGSKYDCSLH